MKKTQRKKPDKPMAKAKKQASRTERRRGPTAKGFGEVVEVTTDSDEEEAEEVAGFYLPGDPTIPPD